MSEDDERPSYLEVFRNLKPAGGPPVDPERRAALHRQQELEIEGHHLHTTFESSTEDIRAEIARIEARSAQREALIDKHGFKRPCGVQTPTLVGLDDDPVRRVLLQQLDRLTDDTRLMLHAGHWPVDRLDAEVKRRQEDGLRASCRQMGEGVRLFEAFGLSNPFVKNAVAGLVTAAVQSEALASPFKGGPIVQAFRRNPELRAAAGEAADQLSTLSNNLKAPDNSGDASDESA